MSDEGLPEGEMEVLSWHAARRDDEALAQALWTRQNLQAVWALDHTALLDDYFHYLKRIHVRDLIERLEPEEGKRFLVPFVQLVMLYLARLACGIRSMNALPDLLFSDEGVMRLIGFNAYQIHEGVCRRGQWRRKQPHRQGPICPEMLSAHIAKMGARTVETFLNQVIRRIAATQVFPARVMGSLDATDLETSRNFPGCGSVTRRRRIRDKTGQLHEIEVTVCGWKVWALMECSLHIPLAVAVAPIHTPDNEMTRRLVNQARKNLGKWAVLDTVVEDRGFLDGADLWWLHLEGIHFVVPAKKTMHVFKEAQALAKLGEPGEVFPGERTETVNRGQGKYAHTEQIPTRLVGVPKLNCYDDFGPEGHGQKAESKDFKPNPINAVVVQTYRGHTPEEDKPAVFLTDLDVSNPFTAYDAYDQRSLIENGLWRNGKQYWHLKRPPQRTQGGLISHVYLTMATMALTVCFRKWAEETGRGLESGKKLGIERYWRKLRAENATRVIAFLGDRYGVFYLSEVLTLAGVPILEPHPKARSLDQLRTEYHLT